MSYTHFRIEQQCIACRHLAVPGDIVVALLSNKESTSYHGCTPHFPFPPQGMQPPDHGRRIAPCRKPDCLACQESPDAFTIHFDCLALYTSLCHSHDALLQIWTLAAWRKPWAKAPPMDLCKPERTKHYEALPKLAEKLGIPRLRQLPPEVLEIIRDFSPEAFLWRAIAVSELAKFCATIRPQKVCTVPLKEIVLWGRGSSTLDTSTDCQLPLVRLSIDSDGIRGIERFQRLAERERSISKHTDCVYIVEDETSLDGINALEMNGVLRLSLPVNHRGLQFWDTPMPPLLNPRRFIPLAPAASQILRTIDLSNVFGLTFFCFNDQIYGIHAHNAQKPSADCTFQQLPLRRQQSILWIYVPLKGGIRDIKVTGTGDGSPNILVNTNHNGVYNVGPALHPIKEVVNRSRTPRCLIYGSPKPGIPISSIAICRSRVPVQSFQYLQQRASLYTDGESHISTASLENIEHVQVFNEKTSVCKGMLFYYMGGAQQAVGECRIGSCQELTFKSPTEIHYRTVQGQYGSTVDVVFKTASTKSKHQDGWTRSAMRGMLRFSYNSDSSDILVDPEN